MHNITGASHEWHGDSYHTDCLFNSLFRLTSNENIKAPNYWSFVRGTAPMCLSHSTWYSSFVIAHHCSFHNFLSMIPLTKGQQRRKYLQVMTSPWSIVQIVYGPLQQDAFPVPGVKCTQVTFTLPEQTTKPLRHSHAEQSLPVRWPSTKISPSHRQASAVTLSVHTAKVNRFECNAAV